MHPLPKYTTYKAGDPLSVEQLGEAIFYLVAEAHAQGFCLFS